MSEQKEIKAKIKEDRWKLLEGDMVAKYCDQYNIKPEDVTPSIRRALIFGHYYTVNVVAGSLFSMPIEAYQYALISANVWIKEHILGRSIDN